MMVESMKLPKRASDLFTEFVSSLRVVTEVEATAEAGAAMAAPEVVTEVFIVNLLTFSDSCESVKH